MVYFYDGNNPGVLYCGIKADIELLRLHGGSPKMWTRSAPAVGSTTLVMIDGSPVEGGWSWEQWPVERPNFAQPWW